jgi:SAM-dependent methyltransferase
MEELARTRGGHVYPWRSDLASGNGEDAYTTAVAAALDPSTVVVEAGCGHGPDIPRFAPHVARYIAYDYAAGLAAIARETAATLGDVEVHVADSSPARGGRIPVGDRSVDLIISRRGPTNFIADARRVLRGGGRMIQLNPVPWVPPWNSELPESLRVPVVPDIEARIGQLLVANGFEFASNQRFDVPEYLPDADALWNFLAWLNDAAPSYIDIRGELENLFMRHAGPQGLELRHRRFLWTAVL